MEKRDYLNILYEYYFELLTEKEQTTFKDYYEFDFSLSEIAEYNNITKSGIHKTIKTVEEKLISYENKLKMYQKREEILSLIEQTNDKELYDKIDKIV